MVNYEFDETLLDILRCPVALKEQFRDTTGAEVKNANAVADPGKLRLVKGVWLVCDDTGCKYPIRDGIPVMLVEEGKRWKETEEIALQVPPPSAI